MIYQRAKARVSRGLLLEYADTLEKCRYTSLPKMGLCAPTYLRQVCALLSI